MITFDPKNGIAYRIDVLDNKKERFTVHGDVTLSPDAAWIIFS